MNINKSLLLAKQHYKNNNLQEAKELYLEILNKFPAAKVAKKELKKIQTKINEEGNCNISQEEKINLMNLYSRGNFTESLDESIRLSKIFHNDAFVHNMMGVSLLNIGKNEEAIEAYKQAIRIKPDYADVYYNIGVALINIDKYKEAIEAYKQAIRIKPDYAEAYNNMGISLMYIGENEEAIEAYRQAIKIRFNYDSAYYNLGVALIKIEKNEEAIEAYKQVIKINPDYVEAYNNMGAGLISVSKYEEAIESCKEAIKIKPDHAEAYSNMGTALVKIGRVTEAIESCKQAVEIKPDYQKAIATLSTILIQSIKVEDIEHLCRYQNTYLIKILLIINLFINKLIIRSELLIVELQNEIEGDLDYWLSNDKDKKFIVAYLEFIDKLNSNILEQENRLHNNVKENIIYHIGESHSLTFAHQEVSLEDKRYIIKPLIIFGTKAWHLGNKNKNQYKTYFENYIKSLNPGSKLILSFGEIDCRVDEGIIIHHLKTKNDLNDIVYETVKNYIDYSENILKTLQIKRTYIGVPAPVAVTKVSDSLNTLRIEVVRLFNVSLMKIAQERQLSVLDVYKLTVNSDGESNQLYMCDGYHLKPSSLNKLNFKFK